MRPFLTKPTELQAPDSDLRSCKALIIDTNQTSRSILRSMLADLGLAPPEGMGPPAAEGVALPEALGWLYVVEGSNLGGAFLLKAAKAVEKAIETILGQSDLRTPDMGGKADTVEMGKAIAAAVS